MHLRIGLIFLAVASPSPAQTVQCIQNGLLTTCSNVGVGASNGNVAGLQSMMQQNLQSFQEMQRDDAINQQKLQNDIQQQAIARQSQKSQALAAQTAYNHWETGYRQQHAAAGDVDDKRWQDSWAALQSARAECSTSPAADIDACYMRVVKLKRAQLADAASAF